MSDAHLSDDAFVNSIIGEGTMIGMGAVVRGTIALRPGATGQLYWKATNNIFSLVDAGIADAGNYYDPAGLLRLNPPGVAVSSNPAVKGMGYRPVK
jgi:hypothetical protein